MSIKTTPGKTYAVTTPGACQVKYKLPSGDTVTVLDAATAGQYHFVAVGGDPEVTNEKAAITECFNAAPAGMSSGGGGTPAPVVIPGQKIVTGNPVDKILRHGEIYHFPFTDNPIDCTFADCTFDDAAGRVITFEVWVDTGYCAPPIDFNGGWQWVGVVPLMSKEYTSYRVTIRKVPGMTPEINYAYCVPLPQQP